MRELWQVFAWDEEGKSQFIRGCDSLEEAKRLADWLAAEGVYPRAEVRDRQNPRKYYCYTARRPSDELAAKSVLAMQPGPRSRLSDLAVLERAV